MLASQGMRAFAKAAAPKLASNARGIHIPAMALPGRAAAARSGFVATTRHLVSRFVSQLIPVSSGAAAAVRTAAPSVARSYHPSIQQSLSLPARIALSRPLRPPHLPRAPAVPRSVTQIGLGTARTFATARPIFANLVENVPVAGRAFWEADWEIKVRQEKDAFRAKPLKKTKKAEKKRRDFAKPVEAKAKVTAVDENKENLEHYFPIAAVPSVTAYLQIPLAPTPSSRVPLPQGGCGPRLLDPSVLKAHTEHSLHSTRVSSLFRRLDAAQVWDKGATCQAYGDPSGLCTLLLIKFEGWTAAMVRSVIGEGGQGWCTLHEEYGSEVESMRAETPSLPPSTMTSAFASPVLAPLQDMALDTSNIELVLPTLDFSSSFLSSHEPPHMSSTAIIDEGDHDSEISDLESLPISDFDYLSSVGDERASDSWASAFASPAAFDRGSRFGFSSDFASRAGSDSFNPFF